ncbi:tRNA (adenosine(37)-N6)-dimethylallyltransferase MiaA [Candidatus Peregrinibacteria bacterium]|nr:tRNA (adenosine(37)-N6)-dimethylallyltransferase MiaA [Candidatus Peregrinibacteria bacterium]
MHSAEMPALQRELFPRVRQSARPLIVILGPTASGKTDFSLETAETLQREFGRIVEIVNADSRQLYRYLDIGTAKIRRDEMRGIAHHLLDVLDPKEEITAAAYQSMAFRTIDDIHARGSIPFLVGGSMLYLSAVMDNLSFVDAADASLRAELEREYDRDHGESLYAELTQLDPDTASGFHPRNKPYLIRALEILRTTGGRPSAMKRAAPCPYDLFIIGVFQPREELAKRIERRTSAMFASGWIDEVQSLIDRGYTAEDPAMKSSGYREVMRYIQNRLPSTQRELEDQIAGKTRRYAKRQMTWWKGDERILWVDAQTASI